MMLPAFFGILDAEYPAAFSAVFGLFSSLMLLVISLAFLPKHGSQIKKGEAVPAQTVLTPVQMNPPQIPAGRQESASEFVSPASAWREPVNVPVNEPGSVTETTTKLLKPDKIQ